MRINRIILLSLALLGAIQAQPVRSRFMSKIEVRQAGQRQAVCNDGSPAAYYFRPGTTADRTKWLILLEGGGSCSFDADCLDRIANQRHLMTSTLLPDRIAPPGIFEINHPQNAFAGFNHVFVQYCSSDIYVGNSEQTLSDGRRIQFRGKRIIEAILAELADASIIPRPNLRDATDVLFAGSSAGAHGVQQNVDLLARILPGVTVKGLLDSSWAPLTDPYGPDPDAIPRPADAPRVWEYWRAALDESCVAANPLQPGQANVCLNTMAVYQHLTTPVFLYVDQRDGLHVGSSGVFEPFDAAEVDYLTGYMAASRQSLEDLQVKYVFSPAVGDHTSLQTSRYYKVRINGRSLAQTLESWYFNKPGPVQLILDGELAKAALLAEVE